MEQWWLRARAGERDERGFTMLEFMIVLTVVAVLTAFGILPTYQGARKRASERATQTNVRNAFVATRIFYNEQLLYTDDPAIMGGVEPSLIWTTAPLDDTASGHSILVKVFNDPDVAQTVVVAGRTKNHRCFYLMDTMGGAEAGTFFDARAPAGGACPAPDPTDPSWASVWST